MQPRRPAGAWQELRGNVPEHSLAGAAAAVEVRCEDAPQHPRDVGVHQRCPALEGERRDGARRVRAHSRELAQRRRVGGQLGTGPPSTRDGAGEPMEIVRSGVVPEPVPRLPHPPGMGRRQRVQRGKSTEKALVVIDHARDLRLLEHELRDEHAIGIACASPGKVAPVATEPAVQPAPEEGRLSPVDVDGSDPCGHESHESTAGGKSDQRLSGFG